MNRNKMDLRTALPDMPASFAAGIQKTLSALPEKPAARGKRKLPKRTLSLLIAAAALLATGTALAAGYFLRMQGSKVGYFDRADDPKIAAKRDYYERQSDAVDAVLGADAEESAVITVNNIAVNNETVTVFYTVKSAGSLPEDAAALRALVPVTAVTVNGGEKCLSTPGANETVQRPDAHTLSFMEHYFMEEPLPSAFTLTVSAEEVFGEKTDWYTDFSVNMSEVVENTRFAVSGRRILFPGTKDVGAFPYWTHDVTIREVRIGKNGGVAVLTEPVPPEVQAEDQIRRDWWEKQNAAMEQVPGFGLLPPSEQQKWYDDYAAAHPMERLSIGYDMPDYSAFVNFAILNDQGKSLNVRCDGISGGMTESQNNLYFQSDYDTKSLTFLPILGSGKTVEKELRFDGVGTPVTIYDGFTVTLLEVIKDQERNEITLRYREEGVRSIWGYSHCRFTGADGSSFLDTGATLSPDAPFRDDVTNIVTYPVTFLDGCDLSKLHGVLFEYETPNIAYDKAVTLYFP